MKKVYISFLLHGNMCYDRYTKQEIRDKFPRIYAAGVRAMHRFPEVTAHIDFPGLTTLSLKHHAQWFLDELKPLVDRGQAVMVGCQYAASHAMCSDEESDLLAAILSMKIMQDELQPDCATFFNQEIPFHPQTPYILNQAGAGRLILRSLDGWTRPRRVAGMDGSQLILYPIDFRHGRIDQLEELFDSLDDGDFIMTGGDFEMLVNVAQFVAEIERLAAKGKIIEWTTVDRYEREVGVQEWWANPRPYGTAREDSLDSPSFSRWVADPEDMIWHGHAVRAMDAVRAAGFAKLAARLHGFADVDVPAHAAWTTGPENVWDQRFEHVLEYPETEERYLSLDGAPTLLSRAWHHLLIGINSDASGWFPWTPRTRHRNTSLQASQAFSRELLVRTANEIAARISTPAAQAAGYALALNPGPARTAEVIVETESPMALAEAGGKPIVTAVAFRNGKWSAQARVELPAYGYRLLGLVPTSDVRRDAWIDGDRIDWGVQTVSLRDGTLSVDDGHGRVEISVAPFRLSDPSGVAQTEDVAPTWQGAPTRVRKTLFGPDLEVFTELAWTVWLRLIIGLRNDRIEVAAELHVDMPRRIGLLGYDPEGLMLRFRGQPGEVYYDVPYATIKHQNEQPSFVAAQRFVALRSSPNSFGVAALGGNQSFQVAGGQGVIAANLGASTQGRPDTRPQCIINPDGTAEHLITSGGDPFLGSYEHRFAVVFGEPAAVALAARMLRTDVALVRVSPGSGAWPTEMSLLTIDPDTAWPTAFRVTGDGCEIVVNDISGEAGSYAVGLEGTIRRADLGAYGIVTVRLG